MSDGICPFAVQLAGVTDYTPGEVDRVGFCDHAAGGFWTTLDDAAFWLNQGVSVHFGVARDGRIVQVTNLFDSPWAEGRIPTDSLVSWQPYDAMGRRNPNGYMVSTEHEDWQLVNGVARAVPGSEWTEAEYQADLKLKRWCIAEVRRVTGKDLMRFGLDSLAGHHMFDPVDRAECPGRFWRESYRTRLYADLTSSGGNEMANLNADGSQRIVSEGNFITTYNANIPVQRLGSTDGRFPGRMSKLFGSTWLWFRTLDDGGQLVAPYWSQTEGD